LLGKESAIPADYATGLFSCSISLKGFPRESPTGFCNLGVSSSIAPRGARSRPAALFFVILHS